MGAHRVCLKALQASHARLSDLMQDIHGSALKLVSTAERNRVCLCHKDQLQGEIITVHFDNHLKSIYTFCGQNSVNFKQVVDIVTTVR